jgi:uncharacterized protein YciI
MPIVTIELANDVCNNLRVLVLAGAKSPHTGEDAIMAGAQILQIIAKAQADAAAQPAVVQNGHDVPAIEGRA